MAQRRPLVLVGGGLQELPAGDTLPAAESPFAASVSVSRTNGAIASVTEMIEGNPRVTTLTRVGGMLTTIVQTYLGKTRTTTITRVDGKITSTATVETLV